MSDMTVKWEDPPAADSGRAGGVTQRFVKALMERPGRWARYERPVKYARNSAYNYQKQHQGTEWVTRAVNGEVLLYARWVGLNGEHKNGGAP